MTEKILIHSRDIELIHNISFDEYRDLRTTIDKKLVTCPICLKYLISED
jgi:hypothetical protein